MGRRILNFIDKIVFGIYVKNGFAEIFYFVLLNIGVLVFFGAIIYGLVLLVRLIL